VADYLVDGRAAVMLELKDWLNEHAPSNAVTESNLTFRTEDERAAFNREKVAEHKERARLNIRWRESLSDRLKIQMDDIVRASNTVVELIEGELAAGGTVRLDGFGDFVTVASTASRRVDFRPSEAWLRELNAPLYKDELGFKFSIQKKKLTRRV